uniref:Uncharacterized protein n=1 Tax=Micromonas pusilla TaxID=38833 RepID=A0A7S0NP88_MICPS|mmetsp:Transcript_9449/g.38640  ORF Transcript_9449/g.38640 Transcript_9449/m.38640 type:complete len:456 (+) Transcript_9449:229-1596(+)
MGRRPPPPVYKRPKDLGRSRTYWWHDGWIGPELRLYAPEQERTASDDDDDDDERPSPSRPSPREERSPRGERAVEGVAEGAAAKASAEGGAGGSDAPERGADRPARSNLEPKKRLTWTQDLKALFRESLAATAAHGVKPSPSKIFEFMQQRDAGARTAGLTRTHVASFLQHYRKAQSRLEIPPPRVVYDDRYVVYAGGAHAGRAMETPEMGLAHHHHRGGDPRLAAPYQPHYQHPALANAMGVPYLHHVTGASVPIVGMGTMGASTSSPALPATHGATGNSLIGNSLVGNNAAAAAVAKGAPHVRSIAPRPTAAHHSPHVVHHPYDARVPMVAVRSPLQPLVQPLHPPAAVQAEAAEAAEARRLETIRLRAAELRRYRWRAAKEAAELAAKEAAAGMERERARTITPEVGAEPPQARGGQTGVGGGSGSEGDAAGDVTAAENASTSTRGTTTADA